MIIKNFEIEKFGRFLFDMSLKGQQSRMRSRFVKILNEHLLLINEERQQIINDYAKKDENGNPVINEHEGQQVMVMDSPEEFNAEMIKLFDEDFIIEETKEKYDMLNTIREIILDCEKEFSGDEAMDYDRWCEIVEDISY